jgi:hypothetical protein
MSGKKIITYDGKIIIEISKAVNEKYHIEPFFATKSIF